MSKPGFIYVTYISTTPEKVWDALTNAELTKEYWGRHRNASDWKAGSTWKHEDYDDPSMVDVVGKVVETDPPKRLVVTWAFPADEHSPEKHSRVTFEVEPFRDAVRLTVTHDELEPDSPMLRGISHGWPIVFSSLKTLLETGEAMPMTTKRWTGPTE